MSEQGEVPRRTAREGGNKRLLGSIIVAYLLGSVPCGLLVGNLKGRDIRRHGSGNIGTANALRVLGVPAALLVFLGDTAKGLLGVLIGHWLGGSPTAAVLSGLAAICGHNWSIFLGFRGGKGVATSFGALLALAPVVALALLPVWILTVALTRYSSLGSLLAAALAPVVTLLLRQGWSVGLFSLAAAALIIWRHKSNIKRLLAGTELRIGDRV